MKIYTIISLCVLTSVSSMGDKQVISDRQELIALALTSIIEESYVKQSNNVFVISNKSDAAHNAILQQMFATLDRNISTTWILHDKDYLNGNNDRSSNVIMIDSYRSFRSILESITTTSFHHFGYYTVAFTKIYDNQDLNNIFSEFWQNMIVNVNILTYSDNVRQSLLLHTYFPFARSHCGEIVPIIWNSFESGHFVQTKKQLFPLKTDDLFQCPISILAIPFQPYIILEGNHLDVPHIVDGIEYNMLQELSKRMNFKLNFSIHWENIGTMYDNGTGTGVWKMASERKYDIVLGGLVYGPNVRKIVSSTKAYAYDNIILVLPYPRPYSSFETLSFPFTVTAWMLILLTLAIAVMVMELLKCNGRKYFEFVVGPRNPNPYFNLLSVFLTGGALYAPKATFARFLLMVWILASVILQTVYQGQLFTFIKMNITIPSAKNIDELIERDISIKLNKDGFSQFLKFDRRLEKLLQFFDLSSPSDYVTETEAYATLETQLVYKTQRINSDDRRLLPKPETITVTSCAHAFILPKRFYLKDAMDDKIIYMNENGLTSKWDAPYKVSAIIDNVVNIPRKLNISHILGMVEVWFGLLILTTILFVLELLSPYLVRSVDLDAG